MHHSRKPLSSSWLASTLLWAILALLGLAHANEVSLEKVRLQLSAEHRFEFAGYYVAQKNGYFREAGLNVEILAGSPAIDPVESVLHNKAEYGIGTSSLLLDRAQGRPVVCLAVIMQHSPLAMLGNKKQNPRDFSGKRIALRRDSEELFAYLKRDNQDKKPLSISYPPQPGLTTLQNGEADLVSVYMPAELYAIGQANSPYRLLSPRAAGMDFYGDNLFTSEHETVEHAKRTNALLHASLRGWEYALAHPEESIALILDTYGSPYDKNQLLFEYEQVKALILADQVPLGAQRSARWERIAELYATQNMLPTDYDLASFIYDPNKPRRQLSPDLRLYVAIILALITVSGLLLFFKRRCKKLQKNKTEELETLAQREKSLWRLLDNAPFPIILTGQQSGRIKYINERAAEFFGAPAAEVINHPIADSYVDPKQRDELLQRIERDGRVVDVEIELQDLQGQNLQILISSAITTFNDQPVIFSSFCNVTAQKHAKEEVINRECQLRSLLENAPVPIVICRAETRQLYYINQRAAAAFELTQEEAEGRSLANFFADQADLELLEARKNPRGEIREFEARLISESGKTFWTLISSQNGKMDELPVVFYSISDITLQKKAEENIADSEQELRRLLDFAPTPILIAHEANGSVLYANRLAGEQTGIKPDQLEHENISQYCTPSELERLSGLLIKEKVVSGFETRLQTQQGKTPWVIMTAARTRWHKQNAMIMGFSNIDERKRMEEILRESEERLRFVTENTADIIWQMDRDFNILYINESDERLRGFPREQLIGKPASQLFTDEYAEYFLTLGNERMRQEAEGIRTGTYVYEAQQIRADGSSIWMEVVSSPQRDEQGEIIFFTGVTRDISERKKAEEKLKATNAKLSEQLEQIKSLQEALQEQAIRDPLTNLFNRRYFDEAVEAELTRARREGYPVSFALLDIDHFKRINDTYGHQAGDEALRIAAKILRDQSRGSDLICRFGGEEFLLLLPKLGLDAAYSRAEDWRQRLASTEIRFGEFSFFIAVSIGLSAYPPHGKRAEDLVRQADEALYCAKNSGRNQVIIASQST